MKKYFNLIVTLVVMLFAGNSFAFTPPPAPQSGWYVSDQTGKLTQEQITSLNQKIEQVSQATKNEFGILFLNTMDGDNIEDVAYATFNSWGIGKRGLDNGCLIVVSLTERKSRIETGKGVGGDVPDVLAADILKTKLNPHLKSGDFAGGFHATLDALGSLIESRHNKTALVVSDPAPNTSAGCTMAAAGVGTDTGSGGGLFFMFLLVVAAFAIYKLKRRSASRKQKAIDDAEALATAELDRQRSARVEAERRRQELERNRLAANAPVVPPAIPFVSSVLNAPPVLPRITRVAKPATIIPPRPSPTVKTIAATAAAGVTAAILASEAERRLRDREREETNRKRREQDEEDRRKRQRDDDDRRSSSSSSSDYGSSSSGGGFDGGSSGGGGASSDW